MRWMSIGLSVFLFVVRSSHAADRIDSGTCQATLLRERVNSLRIAVAQINPTVGDFDYNWRLIRIFLERAVQESAEWVVLPEMATAGYPARDAQLAPEFLRANGRLLQNLRNWSAAHPTGPVIITGTLAKSYAQRGRPFTNSVYVIESGRVVASQAKRLLPDYDVFDESRYYEPAKVSRAWESRWGRIGLTVCEDAWSCADHVQDRKRYTEGQNPSRDLAGARLIINVSASPYSAAKPEMRASAFAQFARATRSPVLMANLVGANDDLVFDGGSELRASDGQELAAWPRFRQGLGIVHLHWDQQEHLAASEPRFVEWISDLHEWRTKPANVGERSYSDLHDALVLGIRDYFAKAGYGRAVLGLSGGVDSTVVANLLVHALGKDQVVGISMPSRYNSQSSQSDAALLAEHLGIRLLTVPIEGFRKSALEQFEAPFAKLSHSGWSTTEDDTTEDNIQARMRGMILLAHANRFDSLVVTTSNKTELAVGQTTTYGDMVGALAPIGDLWKTQVYRLAEELGRVDPGSVPADVLTKPASAELAPGQSDESKFGPFRILDQVGRFFIEDGMSAREIDRQLRPEIQAAGLGADYVQRTLAIMRAAEFKRNQSAIILRVSEKAFGRGRRVPVAQYFRWPRREE